MDWLNEPNKNIQDPEGFCVIRVCNSKGYCDGYWCVVQWCGANCTIND